MKSIFITALLCSVAAMGGLLEDDYLIDGAKRCSESIVDDALAKGANINAKENNKGVIILALKCKKEFLFKLAGLGADHSPATLTKEYNYPTSFLKIINTNFRDVTALDLKALANLGEDFRYLDHRNDNVLLWLAQRLHWDLIKLAIDLGADPNNVSMDGQHYLTVWYDGRPGILSPLAGVTPVQIMNDFLSSNGDLTRLVGDLGTGNRIPLWKELLYLDTKIQDGTSDILKILLPRILPSWKDDLGRNLLQFLVTQVANEDQIIKYVDETLANGFDINARDSKNLTALGIAREAKKFRVAFYLKSKGGLE